MQYNSKDLGQQRRGAIIQVNLTGNAANVRLLDRLKEKPLSHNLIRLVG
jgi:hypothetical protein